MSSFFAREVCIRLTDDQEGFVCTVKYGKFFAKATGFPLHRPLGPGVSDEEALVLARKRPLRWARPEEGQ